MLDPRKHNYSEKLRKLVAEGKLSRGCLTDVDVYHDDWCALHRGGYCNCDPEIELRLPPERK